MTNHRPGARREAGDAAGSHRDPPHVTENDEDAPAQPADAPDAPLSGANASGVDKVSTEKLDQGIDDESMYDRRPSENKDWEPGEE
ncbi:hypothetical protein BH23GEM4_BH23GEM4_01100 [soil metagenome]